MITDSASSYTPFWRRLARFATRPPQEKRISVGLRWIRAFPHVPFPIRLPSGQWWLVRDDVGRAILWGTFETRELRFVEAYLREGMTVLDIGAHHGLYSLLAAHKVGRAGRIVAFEPSERERRCLRWNLRVNRCRNVRVEPFALGAVEEVATLYVVTEGDTGCNSLRVPNITGRAVGRDVKVRRLDVVLEELAIPHVDFIKLDAEGAELSILRGSGDLLSKAPRPTLLVEVYDIRTRPWGYDAREIIRFLAERDYLWFRLLEQGGLESVQADGSVFDDNFVAIPRENLHTGTFGLPSVRGLLT